MDDNIFKFNEFEGLYDLVSKDYDKLRFILMDIIYYKLKVIFIESGGNEDKIKSTLELLTFIKENFNQNSNQDKKQELLIIFSKYFKIKSL